MITQFITKIINQIRVLCISLSVLPGYQPPLELLNQLLTQDGVYDRQRQEFQPLEEALLLAAATLPTIPGIEI